MKKIIIIHANMELGGAETSLLGLLHSFDYNKVSVDLFLLEKKGELLPLIPKEVNILNAPLQYTGLVTPIVTTIKNKQLMVAIARIMAKVFCAFKTPAKKYSDYGYIVKQRMHYYALPFLPQIAGKYDMAISFNDPHFVLSKVQADVKVGWFHTDFTRIKVYPLLEDKMWEICDWIVNVSDSCKKCFDQVHPQLEKKSIVIENILAKTLLIQQATKFSVDEEIGGKDVVKLLSVGRFSHPKNFDNVPDICKKILKMGLNVRWYIIGYGSDEELIRQRIKELEMEEYVIILGKKVNPYPYIKACDIYVQPSRYEGKCVAVREAQILEKPVIITNYATSSSQLEDGIDGIIVPLDNKDCAERIAKVIGDKELQKMLVDNTKRRDYTNSGEINNLYKLVD